MRPSCIYAFDLDGTLLRGNSSLGFYRYALSRGVFSYKSLPISVLFFLGLKSHFLDLSSFYARVIDCLLVTVPYSDLLMVAEEFVKQLQESALYPPTMEKLNEAFHDPSGVPVLFSSSPDFIVAPIANKLGITLWYASEFYHLPGSTQARNRCLTGERKAKILSHLKGIGNARSHTFSDHIVDLPFLLLGEEKTVVRPKGRLKKIAKKYYWNVV